MGKEILLHKGLLHDLTASRNVRTLHAIHKDIKVLVAKVAGLRPVFQTFAAELASLDAFFKRSAGVFDTETIVKKDEQRDFSARAVIAKIRYHYDFAMSDEEKSEARRLLHVAEQYKTSARKNYESETASLHNLTDKLLEMPELLERFGLTRTVDKLNSENEEFESLYTAQANAIRAQSTCDKRPKGSVLKYRMATNKAFDNLCKVVSSMLLMPLSELERNSIESIIDIINRHIKQTEIVCTRRENLSDSKKKKRKDKNSQNESEIGIEKNGS
ncbi:MAG: DUF6261 family protein [Prevotellaceae bacterium]|jgi:hypothetical protein|nr:DUF6261 family protein [Prevotellaceae bacterium]